MRTRHNDNKIFLLRIGIIILISFIVFILISKFFITIIEVDGNSMSPYLSDEDRLVIIKDKVSQRLKRGDIVSFTIGHGTDTYIKRVIGLPNDFIEILGRKIYINGQYFYESYISDDVFTDYIGKNSWKVSNNQVFIIGDNRKLNESLDSRYFGPINIDEIEGIAKFRIYPLDRIGDI